MDLDTLKRNIQEYFQEDTVTIVGSGLSISEGIPGMQELAIELQAKIPTLLSDGADIVQWTEISSELKSGAGLEQTLHIHQPGPFLEENIRKISARFIGASEAEVFKEIQRGRILDFRNTFIALISATTD